VVPHYAPALTMRHVFCAGPIAQRADRDPQVCGCLVGIHPGRCRIVNRLTCDTTRRSAIVPAHWFARVYVRVLLRRFRPPL
jgi:hypothetical protein